MQNQPILIIGGTGKTGRRIVTGLEALGKPVRVASRQSATPFEWQDRSTWPAVLAGVRTVFINYIPDLAVKGAAEDMQAFSQQCKASGVERVVLLSGRGEPRTEPSEAAIKDFRWTVLRCSWFDQNFDEGFFAEPLQHGVLALPVADIPEPFIDVEDIAAVAVKCLTEDGHEGKVYELTGPRAITFTQAVAIMATAAGRELQFTRISMPAFQAQAKEIGIPEPVIELMEYLFGEVLDGRNTPVTDDVSRILGRPAITFETYAKRAAATWQKPAAVHS